MKEEKKGLCFNCDSKYSTVHKCGEKKLFYIDYEEDEEEDKETLEEKQQETPEEITLTISCNALARITTPQTLNIQKDISRIKR